MVTLTHVVTLNLSQGYIDIVRTGQIAGGAHKSIIIEDIEDTGNRCQYVVLIHLRLIGVPTTVTTIILFIAVTLIAAASALLTILILFFESLIVFLRTLILLRTVTLVTAASALFGLFFALTTVIPLACAGTFSRLLRFRSESHIQSRRNGVQGSRAVRSCGFQIGGILGKITLCRTRTDAFRSQFCFHI